MKLLTTPSEYRTTFSSLLEKYKHYYFATAWAGIPDHLHEFMVANADRIKQFAVGIHFYQTDPRFFNSYIGNAAVRAVLQPSGTFHPKIFLFYNDDNDWSVLVGSGNFTKAAFMKNSEAVMFLESDGSNSEVLKSSLKVVKDSWQSGKAITKGFYDSYKLKWSKAKKIRHTLEEPIPANDILNKGATPFMNLTWNDYVAKYNGRRNIVTRRAQMLESIRGLFASGRSLVDMAVDERRFILGNYPNGLNLPGADRYADFGTSGNGDFMHIVIEGDRTVSDALNRIPLVGPVHIDAFQDFLNVFLKAPYVTSGWVSSAARLLAMKRPDVFYNITNANRAGFCTHFNNVQSHTRLLDNYWALVVEKINLSEWYDSTPSNDKFERRLWEARAAMLDVLYYDRF